MPWRDRPAFPGAGGGDRRKADLAEFGDGRRGLAARGTTGLGQLLHQGFSMEERLLKDGEPDSP
jgi:hypothetical protein